MFIQPDSAVAYQPHDYAADEENAWLKRCGVTVIPKDCVLCGAHAADEVVTGDSCQIRDALLEDGEDVAYYGCPVCGWVYAEVEKGSNIE